MKKVVGLHYKLDDSNYLELDYKKPQWGLKKARKRRRNDKSK